MYEKVKDFILRHLVWLTLITAGILFLMFYFDKFFWEFIGTLLMCMIAEGVALLLSNLVLYAFTTIKFTKGVIEGEDKKISATERHGLLLVTGYIFLGVHFVVGIVIAGLYFAQFN